MTNTSCSPSKLEVLRHIADGSSNHMIVEALFISEKTLKSHVGNLLSNLHLAD